MPLAVDIAYQLDLHHDSPRHAQGRADVAGFADAAEMLLDDPALRFSMGMLARERVPTIMDRAPHRRAYLGPVARVAEVSIDDDLISHRPASAPSTSQSVTLDRRRDCEESPSCPLCFTMLPIVSVEPRVDELVGEAHRSGCSVGDARRLSTFAA